MKKLLLVLAMSLVCLSHGAQAGEIGVSSKEHSRVFALVMEGQDLSDEEARDLATTVADAEGSLDARLKLIGYYDNQRSREGREARQEQMFWVAENAPKSCIRKSCKTILRPGLPETTRWVGIWESHVNAAPEDVDLLFIAAEMTKRQDPDFSRSLLFQLKGLVPKNPHVALDIALAVSDQSRHDTTLRDDAYRYWLEAIELLPKKRQIPFSAAVADAALEAGEMDDAVHWATIAIEKFDAIHRGNTTLGLVAVRTGDIETAELHLQRSAEINPNTQFAGMYSSFGPGMSLAKELYAEGRSESVTQYLTTSKKIWKEGTELLDLWIEQIASDQAPSFDTMERFYMDLPNRPQSN